MTLSESSTRSRRSDGVSVLVEVRELEDSLFIWVGTALLVGIFFNGSLLYSLKGHSEC